MSKEDKPLPYQRRLRDTKGVAQRLDLDYLRRPALLALLRSRLTWGLLAVAALAAVPLVFGVPGGRRAVENGTLSPAHAAWENRCEVCHTQAFGGVPDRACQSCHDGAAHPAKPVDTAHATAQTRCAECHREHRGNVRLAAVGSAECTACHSDIRAHAPAAKVANASAFLSGQHPEFAAARTPDVRPLRLNHAVHMPAQPKVIRGMKLPMACIECHVPDRNSASGQPLPVTFEANCKSCHARELEFDVYGVGVPPAPHTRNVQAIRDFIRAEYVHAAAIAGPSLLKRPLGNDLSPQPSVSAWLARVTRDSEAYLFERKCVYCHTNGVAESFTVGPIAGRFPNRQPWLPRGEFEHRAHRAVECESCHTAARASIRTSDVLIPAMRTCLPCHDGRTSAPLAQCSLCHQYHNRNLEQAPKLRLEARP